MRTRTGGPNPPTFTPPPIILTIPLTPFIILRYCDGDGDGEGDDRDGRDGDGDNGDRDGDGDWRASDGACN